MESPDRNIVAVKTCRGIYNISDDITTYLVINLRVHLVKMIKISSLSSLENAPHHEINDLWEELQLMKQMKPHENILNLLSYCTTPGMQHNHYNSLHIAWVYLY